tara:strand:- start:78 stop:1763 length:1686 start_codon:yes stop_codon:yes gene_type:complete
MPGVYVGVGCSFVKANKVFVGVGCSFVEATKVYTAENCNWKVIHEAGGKGLIALVGPGGTTGINPDVNWSSYRSIVALSDDTVAFAVNENDARSTTLIKIDSKGNSVWQRQSDRFQTSITWENKVTLALIKDSNDNIYQLGRAAQPSSFKGVEWIQKFNSAGTYQWDRTTALRGLLTGFTSGNPGTNEVYHAVFNGPDGDEESSMQVEAQSDRSNGSGDQEFLTGVSTFDTSDGSLDSFRINGSSGGTGNNNGNNYGREICRLGDKIYSASQAFGHKCASVNGPCFHVANIYRRSLDGQTVDGGTVGGGRVDVNSTSYPLASTGCVYTNDDETYNYPILGTYYKNVNRGFTPGKNLFFFYTSDLDLTDILKYELTGPATAVTANDITHIPGSGVIWDSSNNHIYFLQAHIDLDELSIIEFDVATGTIQNQNRFRITNANDRIYTDTHNCATLAMTSDKFYIQSQTNRFDNTGVNNAYQVIVLQVPRDLTKGFGDYGDNLVYEPRPANDLYTLSSSTENLGYSGPGGSYYWPIPGTRTHGTQDENTTPTADNIPIGVTKQKN